jgi:putative ABC transport system permease protein
MSQLIQDLRFAVRNLSKQPSLAVAAILTLALGIGVNAAIFSIVDSVLLTPPPFRDPDRVVIVWASNPKFAESIGLVDELPSAPAHLLDWQKASSVEKMASFQANRLALTGEGFAELVGVVKVTGNFFDVLGAVPELGRVLGPDDDPNGKGSAVVLSHSLWQRKFNGDPKVIGKVVTLSGHPYTVVGVMGPRFNFPRGGQDAQPGYGFAPQPDLWMPLEYPAEARQDLTARGNMAIARLKPGVSVARADQELKGISAQVAQTHPDTEKGWSVRLQPIMEKVLGDIKLSLLILWAVVGLVLLIACANVTNLLLARAASRQKEIAVRMAMGAGRNRLIAQLLTESGLLAVVGGALGVFLAWLVLRLFASYIPTGLIGSATMSLNGRAVLFTAFLCILTTLLAGLVPALQMSRPNLAGTLREGTRAGAGTAGSHRMRSLLVVLEVGIAVLVLIGAGLLLRSFVRLINVDPGFKPQHILTAEFGLTPDRIPVPERGPFIQRVLDKVKTVPGVSAAALISDLPMGVGETVNNVSPEGQEAKEKKGEVRFAALRTVSPGYFELMGVPLRSGRYFTDADREGTLPVAVINDVMAKDFWPGENPIGKRFRMGLGGPTLYTVVGVVAGIRYSGLQGELRSEMYRLVSQAPKETVPFMMRIVMRTQGDPAALTPAVRAAVKEVDPGQPVSSVQTMEQMVAKSVAKQRFSLLLFGLFALLALVLSIIGIYGVTSYSVAQRTRELGLRMALGAQPGGILGMVIRETGTLTVIGVVIGVVAAWALTRFMEALLFGVKATDPSIFLGISLILLLVSVIAAFFPGRRATRIDPLVALRAE